ncbi:MAG: Transketolase [Paenibacillaceae bacterium]|jgi:transketolase|nr:Transketolase [Paenibacillaceae bacterium]
MTAVDRLQHKAQEHRITIIDMIHKAGSGHSGGSLSCIEILTVLYEEFMTVDPSKPGWEERDRFVLSKGHAAPALYAILAGKGYFHPQELDTLRRTGSILQGHPCMFKLPGVEMSTGSLGMGISVGVGMALAAKLQNRSYRTFVLCGDGEMQEGQNWEAMMSIGKWQLDNLVLIIDRNHVQLDGTVEEVLPLGDLHAKLRAFGLHVISCDGHRTTAVAEALKQACDRKGPVAIVAETVKGKGISFMEGQSAWHGKPIGPDEYRQAMAELREAL